MRVSASSVSHMRAKSQSVTACHYKTAPHNLKLGHNFLHTVIPEGSHGKTKIGAKPGGKFPQTIPLRHSDVSYERFDKFLREAVYSHAQNRVTII